MKMPTADSAPPDRRTWLRLAGLATLSAGGLGGPAARAADAAPEPKVWRELDQRELDRSFDLPAAAPNFREVTRRWALNSDQARAALGPPRRLSYGPSAAEALDWYPTAQPHAPVHVFIHGGAFNLEEAAHFGFIAEAFVRAGVHFVALDFARARDVGGDVRVLLAQVRQAVAWVRRNAAGLGAEGERLFVSGHSSGAELAARVALTDWERDHRLPADTVKGTLCCSGVYDMAALRLAAAGRGFLLGPAVEEELSIVRQAGRLRSRLLLAHGSAETPAFRIGARDLAAELARQGRDAALRVAEGYNHFEVVETLANPYGVLGREMLHMILGA